MDGESSPSTNLGRRLLMIGRHPRRPRGRAESLEAGVQARAVNLVVCGHHQRVRAASQELAVLTVKESPFCRML